MRAAAAIIIASSALGAALGFLATIAIARAFATVDFGFYASLIAAWGVLAPLCSLGLGKLLLRSHARGDAAATARLAARGGLIITGLCLLTVAAVAALGPALHGREPLLYVLLGTALFGLSLQGPAKALFQCERNWRGLALWLLAQPAARCTVAVAALALALPFPYFLALFAVAELAVGSAALYLLAHFQRRQSRRMTAAAGAPMRLRHLLAQGGPFALSGTLYMIYYQADIIMLGLMVDLDAAGLYMAAFTFVAAAYLLPGVYFQRYLLPTIFAWWQGAAPWRPAGQSLLAAIAYGLAAGGLLYLLAEPLVATLLGADYTAASEALRLLAAAVLFHSGAIAVGAFLVTASGIRAKVRVQAATAALNIALNLALIPHWGILGAAAATVLTEIVLVFGYGLALWGQLRRPPAPAVADDAGSRP